MQTGLQPAVTGPNYIRTEISLAEPELTLRRATGEDHMGKALDFTPDRLIRSLAHARRAIGRTACHRDQNVLLRPSTLGKYLAQFLEIDLELVGPISSARLGRP